MITNTNSSTAKGGEGTEEPAKIQPITVNKNRISKDLQLGFRFLGGEYTQNSWISAREQDYVDVEE